MPGRHDPDETCECPTHVKLRSALRWKEEAITVLEGWERVWEALGRPGELGSSKYEASLDEVFRLQREVDSLRMLQS